MNDRKKAAKAFTKTLNGSSFEMNGKVKDKNKKISTASADAVLGRYSVLSPQRTNLQTVFLSSSDFL